MKEKFKEWANEVDENSCGNEILHEVAAFLQSLANMQEQEPDEDVIIGNMLRTDIVTKENRDYWMKRCINTLQLTSKIDSLSRELSAKDARIKQLEHSLLDKMTADNQAMGLYNDPRPLLNRTQFNALITTMRAIAEFPNTCDGDIDELENLLVGK